MAAVTFMIADATVDNDFGAAATRIHASSKVLLIFGKSLKLGTDNLFKAFLSTV